MNGIVILNKETGISSNTACRKVGKILGEKKVGHLGTLDPMAEGVLPIALGKCTKLFDYYLNKVKTYVADFSFGYETDTLDREGKIILENGNIPTLVEITSKLSSFVGENMQLPPKFSAKKVNGKRAYDLARNNVEFELKPKLVNIFKFDYLKQIDQTTHRFLIECSAGTYIRSIARDLAYSLNTYATMTRLHRIKCGEFSIENSYEIDKIDTSSVILPSELFKNRILEIDETQLKIAINTGYIQKKAVDDIPTLVKANDVEIGIAIKHNEYYKMIIRLI